MQYGGEEMKVREITDRLEKAYPPQLAICLLYTSSADREDFARLKELANEKEIEVLSMEAGDRITAKDGRLWEISCLAPDAEKLCGESNEDSMVLMLTYGRFRMLFTGDLEKEAEKRLAQSGTKLRADVLKAVSYTHLDVYKRQVRDGGDAYA